MAATTPIRIGFVPEHYLLPLHLAAGGIKSSTSSSSFPFPVTLIPFPSGTGHMVTSLRAKEIDVAIGLTEGWVAGLLNDKALDMGDRGYRIVGSWVENPLRWAIVTGKGREGIESVEHLGRLSAQGNLKVGVSRLGSGSHVMASVLAREQGWGMAVDPVVLGPFKDLRDGVNEGKADFFMWEHFTTKVYWEGAQGKEVELKRIGEIYTPWPSWHVVVGSDVGEETVQGLFQGFDQGMKLFDEGGEEGVVKVLGTVEAGCHYGEEDAREWFKGVKFAKTTKGVSRKVMENVVEVLKGARVIGDATEINDGDGVIGVER